jgi:hypothetical protein
LRQASLERSKNSKTPPFPSLACFNDSFVIKEHNFIEMEARKRAKGSQNGPQSLQKT